MRHQNGNVIGIFLQASASKFQLQSSILEFFMDSILVQFSRLKEICFKHLKRFTCSNRYIPETKMGSKRNQHVHGMWYLSELSN